MLLTQHGPDRLDEITARLTTELAEERKRLIEILSRWSMVLAARGLTPTTAAPRAELRQMGHHEKPLIWKLLQLYLDELSRPVAAFLARVAYMTIPPLTTARKNRATPFTCSR